MADDAIPAAEAPKVAESAAKPPSRRRTIGIAVGATVLLVGVGWYVMHRGLESTDDAQVDGDVIAISARTSGAIVKVNVSSNEVVKAGDVIAEMDDTAQKAKLDDATASLEGARAMADAADADARLAEINAHGQKKLASATLTGASVGVTTSEQQIKEGEAQVSVAQTTLDQAQREKDRSASLFASGAITKAQMDTAQSIFDGATASVAQAKARLSELRSQVTQQQSRVVEASARLDQASDVETAIALARSRARNAKAMVGRAQATRDLAALDLSYTKIIAPQAGVISKKSIGVGQLIAAGQNIAMLVLSTPVWVTANFKETQVGKMRPHQPVDITIDSFPSTVFHGEIDSLSPATGAKFTLLPPDNATGNYTKVVQRVPVRIRFTGDVGVPLSPGLSAEVTVNTRK